MKKTLMITACILLTVIAPAQDNLKQEETIRRIAEASAAIEAFSCDFSQVREVAILSSPDVSEGMMQYRRDGRILWRYTSPSPYQIAFTQDAVVITRDGQTRAMNLSENPYMGYLRDMLLGIMSGRQLASEGKFQITVKQYEPDIIVSLVPVQRQLKRLFSEIVISFTGKDCLVREVTLNEVDGSSTHLTFSNRKQN